MKKIALNIIFLGIALFAVAQNPQSIKQAIKLFEEKNYASAHKDLEQIIKNQDKISKTDLAVAYYYFGKSSLELFQQASVQRDTVLLTKFINAPLTAFESYTFAKNNGNVKIAGMAAIELQNLYMPLLRGGTMALQKNYNNLAIRYLNAASEINPDNFESVYWRSLAFYNLGQFDAALFDCDKAIKIYRNSLPAIPDFAVAYAFYRKALIFRYTTRDFNLALASLHSGLEFIEKEWQRVEQTNKMNEDLKITYRSAKIDLEKFLLDTYYRYNGDNMELGIKNFERALQKFPDNYRLIISYASFLEKFDKKEAIPIYEKAITIDSANATAYFNISSIYIDSGINIMEKLDDVMDKSIADILKKELENEYRIAWSWLMKGHAAVPGDVNILNAIVELADFFGMEKEKSEFEKKKTAAMKFFKPPSTD